MCPLETDCEKVELANTGKWLFLCQSNKLSYTICPPKHFAIKRRFTKVSCREIEIILDRELDESSILA